MIFNYTNKLTRAKEIAITTCVDWIPLIAGGVLIRNLVYRLLFKKIGSSVYIQQGAEFTGTNCIELGSNSFIACGTSITIRNVDSEVIIRANARLDKGVVIDTAGDNCCIEIGEDTFIGPYTCIAGSVKIGKYCLIAGHSGIIANNRIFSNPIEMICKQGVERQGIIIEDNCWLGFGVKVLDGVTIGEGSVIGAGAVVTKDIPAYSVAVGIPAKVIRNRQHESQLTDFIEHKLKKIAS